MLNVLIFSYIFNFVIDDYFKQLCEVLFMINYTFYKIGYNSIIFICSNLMQYVIPSIIKLFNLKLIFYLSESIPYWIKFIKDYIFYYNGWLFKFDKRRKIFYRFFLLSPWRFLFYIYFLIILIYIWKRRTMYKKTYLIFYYFVFYFIAVYCTYILYNIILYEWLSGFISLTVVFFFIILSLK